MFRHYKQYEALSPREVSEQLQQQAAERKADTLARVEPLDLSVTTWPAYPPHAVVNAITYAARRGLHRYLDRHSVALRSALAHEVGVPEERLVVGDGIAQLVVAAAQALLEPADELVTPWPSYGLYPVAARRARGSAVPGDAQLRRCRVTHNDVIRARLTGRLRPDQLRALGDLWDAIHDEPA
jgi:histidinol-phosphate aminotransferase